jgi:hypothetical protein
MKIRSGGGVSVSVLVVILFNPFANDGIRKNGTVCTGLLSVLFLTTARIENHCSTNTEHEAPPPEFCGSNAVEFAFPANSQLCCCWSDTRL